MPITNINSVLTGQVSQTIETTTSTSGTPPVVTVTIVDRIVSATAGLTVGMAIIFKNSFSTIIGQQMYYIESVPTSTYFTVSENLSPLVRKSITSAPTLSVPFVAIDLNEIGTNFIANTQLNQDFEINYNDKLERIAVALETIAQTSAVIKTQAETTGIHIIGPYEWLGYASIVKLFEEKGINFAELKAKVDAITKSY
jgi:hypothetical protein